MAKGSPKKGSPTKSGSPTKGGTKNKNSPVKRNLPKWSVDECMKAEEETFARKRYEAPMYPSYKRVALHIALIVRKIHIFEIYNEIPVVEQFCNSNKDGKGSPKSKSRSPKKTTSPKNKEKSLNDKNNQSDSDPFFLNNNLPIVEGVVALRRHLLLNKNEKLFVEISATWKYEENSKIPPFPPSIRVQHQCYRDYYYLYPPNFERFVMPTNYNQTLIQKIRTEYGAEWEGYPFYFDLSGAPNSITFNRPYTHKTPHNGIFWMLRCFIGKHEFSQPLPGNEVKLNFWKFTIVPSVLTLHLRKSSPFSYIRYKTLDDIGDLFLSASLNRDLYFHGEEIILTITIENNSQRHVINSITVFYEQNYRFFNEIPHDNSIPLNEIWLKSGENGLPINPKSKNWCKTIQIKPLYDWSKYNLVCDGKMERDDKIFLASSTIIMKNIPLSLNEIEPLPVTKSPKVSPEKKNKKSPKVSPEKKEKKSPKVSPEKQDKRSAKKESPKTNKKQSPAKETPISNDVRTEIPTKQILTNRALCHSVYISYDIVVRINLQTPTNKEAGHPAVRVPFILTRETRFINKWTNPPTWNHLSFQCDETHTRLSQPHLFCKKYEIAVETLPKSPNSKKNSPKKSKSSPKKKS